MNSTLIGNNLLLQEQFFSLRVDPTEKGGNYKASRVASLEDVPTCIHLK